MTAATFLLIDYRRMFFVEALDVLPVFLFFDIHAFFVKNQASVLVPNASSILEFFSSKSFLICFRLQGH